MSNLDLARRAVACKHWRWMPGMLAIVGVERQRVLSDKLPAYGDWLPDLTDAATLGCLLALVRDAWGDDGLHCAGRYSDGKWLWHVQGGHPHGATFRRRVYAIGHGTEAEALVAALEAAPC